MTQVDTSIYGNMLRPVKSVQEYDAEAQQAESNKLGLLLQRLEHGAGRGGVGGAGGHLHPWFWRHDWLRALVAAARRMA